MVFKYMDLPADQKQAMKEAITELQKAFIVVTAKAGLDGDDFQKDCFTFYVKLKPIKK